MRKKLACVLVFAAVASVKLVTVRVTAQSTSGARTGGANSVRSRTVGETYKNLQVLTDQNDAPASDLFAAMQFMSGSLGVSCNYCHVSQQGPFDSDVNKTKLRAREMIKMVRSINQNSFAGRQVVTCNTCHQGSAQPNSVPHPWYKTPEQIIAYKVTLQPQGTSDATSAQTARAPTLPDADQIITAYRKAVGAKSLRSIHVTGSNNVAAGASVNLEAYIVFPDKFFLRTSNSGVETTQVLDGDRGWRVTSKGRTELTPDEVNSIRERLEPIFAGVKFERMSEPRKVIGLEKIGDDSFYVLESQSAAQNVRLYFNAKTGLLYKQRVEVATWLGTRVEEKTFENYRDVSGIKLACLVTNHYMEDESVFNLERVQSNIKVDPALFNPPATK